MCEKAKCCFVVDWHLAEDGESPGREVECWERHPERVVTHLVEGCPACEECAEACRMEGLDVRKID